MTPYVDHPDLSLYVGGAEMVLRGLPSGSVHAVLCSPPFYGLRDYGVEGQIGLEESPEEWAAALVRVFGEARRVLRDDGTLWVECGDSYASKAPGTFSGSSLRGGRVYEADRARNDLVRAGLPHKLDIDGVKPKDMIGAPFLLALALRADGWYWRGTYIWEKPDAMPESATDRCTTAHSYLFHFSKRARYFHDRDAIREPFSENTHSRGSATPRELPKMADPGRGVRSNKSFVQAIWGQEGMAPDLARRPHEGQLDLDGNVAAPEERGPDGRRVLHVQGAHNSEQHRDGHRWPSPEGRNARSVWRIATEATSFGLCRVCRTFWPERAPAEHCGEPVVAHFATWPHALAGRIIACATSEAGCCGECGAPRVRESDRTVENPGNRSNNGQRGRSAERRGFDVRRETRSATLGWRPSCGCDADTVPCVVLDPFAGSGTTGRQARTMGRRSVLIELSPDYAEIAEHRTAQLGIIA